MGCVQQYCGPIQLLYNVFIITECEKLKNKKIHFTADLFEEGEVKKCKKVILHALKRK